MLGVDGSRDPDRVGKESGRKEKYSSGPHLATELDQALAQASLGATTRWERNLQLSLYKTQPTLETQKSGIGFKQILNCGQNPALLDVKQLINGPSVDQGSTTWNLRPQPTPPPEKRMHTTPSPTRPQSDPPTPDTERRIPRSPPSRRATGPAHGCWRSGRR